MQNHLFITATVAELEEPFIVTQLFGEEKLSSPFYFTIKAFTNKQKISLQNIIRKPITLKLSLSQSTSVRTINGIITTIQEISLKDQAVKYTIEICAKFKLLDHSLHCRIFKQQSSVEIVSLLLEENHIDVCLTQLHHQYPLREYCVQYKESTFNFISRLLEDAGISYYFKHSENTHTMVLVDHPAYYPKASATYPVAFWNQTLSIHNTVIALSSQPELSAPQKLYARFGHANVDSLKTIKSWQQFTFSSRFVSEDMLMREIQVESQRAQCQQTLYTARSSYVSFYAGLCFNDTQKDGFIIKKIQHRASSKLQRYQNQLTCIPSSQYFRPPRKAKIPKIEGAQIATVMGPNATKIHTDDYARVQVQFDWATTPSCWIRVCQASCGDRWGAQFIPNIGDKVLVQFLDGNPDRPIICGSLYDSQNKPALDLPAQGWQRGFSFGHQFIFDDTPGKQKIKIASLGDIRINVKRDMQTDILGDETLSVDKGDYRIQTHSGKINLQASSGIEMCVGSQKISITPQGIKICGKRIILIP